MSFIFIIILFHVNYPLHAHAFEMERPSDYVTVNRRVENAYADLLAAVGVGVHICSYKENTPDTPFVGRDGFMLRIVGTANTRKGIWYEYEPSESDAFPFKPNLPQQVTLGDDEGIWVDTGFPVAFYSGPGEISIHASEFWSIILIVPKR